MKPWMIALLISLGILLLAALGSVGYFAWCAGKGLRAVRYTPSGPLPQITVPTYPEPADNGFEALAEAAAEVKPYSDAIHEAYELAWDDPSPLATGVLYDCAEASAAARDAMQKGCLQPQSLSIDDNLPHLGDFRALACLWVIEGRRHEREGRHPEAAASYLDCLRLANVGARNGTLLHLFSAKAVTQRAVPELARCVGTEKMDESHLAVLADRLDACIAETVPFHEVLSLEWAYEAQILDDLRDGKLAPQDLELGAQSPAMCATLADSGRKEIQEKLGAAIEEARKPYWQWTYTTPQPQTIMAAVLLPEAERLAPQVARRDAQLQGLRLLIAAHRYKANTGRLPASADELIPECIESLPIDPCDGQPLRYVFDGAEYRAYGVGTDRIDDHGLKRLDTATDAGDIVIWPAGPMYLATP